LDDGATMSSNWSLPLWIAHRGAGKLAPENTLAAFRVGARHGYRAFECDVKLSADGVPFLLHDTTLERTTPEHGIAGERSWSELSRIDAGAWHSRAYAGEPIASLDAVARYCIRNGFALNIEIKPTPGTEELTGRTVAREVQRLWAGETALPLLSSFQSVAIAAVQQLEPTLPRALLFDGLRDGWLAEAQSLGCVAVVADHGSLGNAQIAQIHAAGLRAVTYTVNDPAPAMELLANGIDGIVTDAVDRFSPGTSVRD